MDRPTRTLLACLLITGALAAGCSDDPDPIESGDDYSVYDALSELPSSLEDEPLIFTGDLARAGEVAGLERPTDPDDSESTGDWVLGLSAGSRVDGTPQAYVPLLPALGQGLPAEKVKEVGWSVVDVDSFVGTTHFLVASGDFDDNTLADLPEVDDGIVTDIDDQEEEESDGALGLLTRFAEDDGRLAASSETDTVKEWLDDGESLADDAAYADVAKALDEQDAYSAAITRLPDDEAYDLVGIGWSEDDDEPLVSAAYHFDSEDAAEDNVDSLRERFESEDLAEHLDVEDAGTEGASVVVTTRVKDDAIDFLLRALFQLAPPIYATPISE